MNVVEAKQDGHGSFRSTRGLSIAIVILLALHATLSAVLIVVWPTVLQAAGDGYEASGAWDAVCAIALVAAALLQWAIFIATAACFLVWLHRAYANLPALGSESILSSPRSAVVGWFIPFANLVHGYRSVHMLYLESQPRAAILPSGFALPRSAPIVGLWWGFYLLRGITSRIADKMFNRASDGALGWLIASELFDIIAAVLCILIVYRIEKRQRDQHDDLVRREAAGQPPPADRLR